MYMKKSEYSPISKTLQSMSLMAVLTAATTLLCLPMTAQAATPAKAGQAVTLNFQNAEIEAVARTFASITGRNVVVDPRVKGTITLINDKPVSRVAAMNQFLAALRQQGFTIIETAGLYKVVPEAEAKMLSADVMVQEGDEQTLPSGNQIATQIFKLNHESANNLVAVLRPLISANNTINANPGNNSLVITDYGDNLRRLARIIAAMDVANATDVDVITLKHAVAVDLAPLLLRLIGNTAAGAAPAGTADTAFKTTVLAEPRANALIVRASNGAQLALVRSLIQKLDQPDATGNDGSAGNIHVVYLKNADATKLASTLRAALSGTVTTSTTAPAGTQGAQVAPAASTGGQIQADAATNSLIITASDPQYRQLRAVIEKLDGRRAQVLVESLIAEVNTDKAAQFGIQWQALLGNSANSTVGVLGSNFSIGGTNLFSLGQALRTTGVPPATSIGGNLGIAHQTSGGMVLGALANLLQSTGDGNVLATPTLLTLDNEEAKIVVGQNVPFVTGSYSNTGSGGGNTANPFTTVERKDVGLTLKVKPQISEDGSVKLVIYQEVSSVQDTSNLGPTTKKRSIESTVLVSDGNIVVLGGLLQDDYSGKQEKVPGLGDVPLFGALFRSDTRTRKKTNLMVFLRPVIVRSSADTEALSFDRYDAMRGVQQSAQPTESTTVPVNQAPIMSPLPAPPSKGSIPAPLLPLGLSGTWGGAPASATQQDVTGSTKSANVPASTPVPAQVPAQ
jgi:general secretion pathway protein D